MEMKLKVTLGKLDDARECPTVLAIGTLEFVE